MIVDDEKLEIKKVYAPFIIRHHSRDTYIEIVSEDSKSIIFAFNREEFNPKQLEKNKEIDLKKFIYSDVELVTNETYYLFDLTKDKISLVRLDNNIFNLKVNIENPDMIYSPLSKTASFKNLIIDTNFSFIYEVNDMND